MIKYLRENLKTRKRLRLLKKYFEPRKEFLKEAKILFLHKATAKDIKLTRSRVSVFPLFPSLKIPAYAFASVMLLLVMSAGTIALAEKQNVSPENPLYNLKRVGEKMQVQLAPETQKTGLHQKFAKRRLEEIRHIKSEIQKTDGDEYSRRKLAEKQQKTLEELNKDFRKDVTFVIETIEVQIMPEETTQAPAPPSVTEEPPKKIETHESQPEHIQTPEEIPIKNEIISKSIAEKRAENLCQSVLEMIGEHEEMENNFDSRNSDSNWREIKNKCSPVLEKNNKSGDNGQKKFKKIENNDGKNKSERNDQNDNDED